MPTNSIGIKMCLMNTTGKRLLLVLSLTAFPVHSFAESFLVENGEPRAEIVIASDPPRSTRLAAHELQTSLEKISGAKLRNSIVPVLFSFFSFLSCQSRTNRPSIRVDQTWCIMLRDHGSSRYEAQQPAGTRAFRRKTQPARRRWRAWRRSPKISSQGSDDP